MSLLETVRLDPTDREKLADLLRVPEFELVPLRSALPQAGFLPKGARVTVTASPARGLEPTLELASALHKRGFRAVPHLAARSVRDQGHLETLLEALEEARIRSVFVVAGDAEHSGAYPDGLSLLEAIAKAGYPLEEVGIPAYPDGHAFLPDDVLQEALTAKEPHASYATTQICFDPNAIRRWIETIRGRGFSLPLHLGVVGAVSIHRLLAVSARIGVGDSVRFLRAHRRLLRRLSGRYTPDELLVGLASTMTRAAAGIDRLHLYTFNQVEATEAWRAAALRELEGPP